MGSARESHFMRTPRAAESGGVETKRTLGLLLYHQERMSNRSSVGSTLIQVWGNLIFPSWLKEQRKMWTREKESALECLL